MPILAFIGYAVVGRFSTRIGRRPLFIIFTSLPVVSIAMFIAAIKTRGTTTVSLLAGWQVIGAFGNVKTVGLLASIYVVDTTERPQDRYVFFSSLVL